jgi:Na+-transporting NADH:ubiquinone oxidoreductase subunit NqrD
MKSIDSGVVEIVGRHRLIQELLSAGLEVAIPQRDRGIDLIAYVDRDSRIERFVGIPIQLKAATGRSFSIATKYSKFPNLIHAFVWGLGEGVEPVTYAMTQAEAVALGEAMGWTTTESWKRGYYTSQRPGKKLLALLEPYRMNAERWWERITQLATRSR